MGKGFIPIWIGVSALLLFSSPMRAYAVNEVMESLEVMGAVGVIAPVGKLADALDPSPGVWLQAKTGYVGAMKARVGINYALLDGEDSPASVHYARGGVGLEYEGWPAWVPVPSFGVSLYFARVAQAKPGLRAAYLESNESEFGAYVGFAWKVPLQGRWRPEAGLVWDLVFSRPHLVHLPGVYAGMAWEWK